MQLAATLTRVGGRAQVETVDTVDISEGGAGVVAPNRFNVGDVVVLSVESGGVSVEHQGLVVGSRPAGRSRRTVNIAFKTMSDQTLRALRQLVATQGSA